MSKVSEKSADTFRRQARPLVSAVGKLDERPRSVGATDAFAMKQLISSRFPGAADVLHAKHVGFRPDALGRCARSRTIKGRSMLSRRSVRWIPARLLAVNVTLAALSLSLAAYIIWEVQRPFLEQTSSRSSQLPAAAPREVGLAPAVIPAPIIAQRNLFSPSRTESPVTQAAAAAALTNPSLHGVVLGASNNPIAYLQDPTTKRVAGYQIGEQIAGGIIRAIEADRVVIERSGNRVDIRLRDPLRPRAAVAASGGFDVRETAVASVEPPQQGLASQPSALAPKTLMPSRNYRSPFQRLVPAGGLPVMPPGQPTVPARAATAG